MKGREAQGHAWVYEGCNATARLRGPVNHRSARYRASHEHGMFIALVRAIACRIERESCHFSQPAAVCYWLIDRQYRQEANPVPLKENSKPRETVLVEGPRHRIAV